ncbi:MAG: sigma-70 family RNA polymerase sigma factor [Clostridia bacterium]|nr:sigma-70 family RNA polymerase sigma factor [Clostridia bacterium]
MKDIYGKYRDAMLADALKKLGDIHLAEDCVQEAFLIFCRKLDEGLEFENEISLCRYLYKINGNVAGHIARKRMFEARAFEEYLDGEPVDRQSVEEEIVAEERAEELDLALRSIPIHHAVAAVFRYGYDLSYEEMAKNLGNNSESARKYSQRGLKELQDKFEKEGE